MADPAATALFDEYDAEYCAKATDVARKIDGAAALGAGVCGGRGEGGALGGARSRRAHLAPHTLQAPARPPCARRRPT